MSLRRISTKRRARLDAVTEWREAFVREVGACDWCGDTENLLDVHEISQGPDRQASLDNPACLLVLDRRCHDVLHRMPERREVGLALLKINRREDYDLDEFWRVTSRRYPDPAQVELWVRRLSRS